MLLYKPVIKKLIIILIFISLILATLQEGSSEVTPFEFLTAGILAIVFFCGMIQFLFSYNSIAMPLFYLVVFLIWAGVNVIIALTNNVGLLWWFRRFFPVLTLSLTALTSMVAFRSQKEIKVAFITLIFIGLMVVLQALVQIRSLDQMTLTNLQDLRKYGGGYFSAFGLCLTVPFLFCRPQLRQPIWFLVACVVSIFSVGLVLSFTRTYWISTAVAFLFMIYPLARVKRVKFFVLLARVILFIILIFVLFLWIAPPTISEFFVSRIVSIPQAGNDLSFLDRVTELQGLWDSAIKNPITLLAGNGLGAKFTFYSVNPFSWGGTGWIENDYSHNYYAYLFWSIGIIGLFLFLLFWGSLFRRATKALCYSSNSITLYTPYYLIGICTAMTNLLVASLAGPPLTDFKWAIYFGVLIGIALNLMKLLEATSEKPFQ